jgi:membrane-bound metal-dependent hydrolase YbcI (DUF457 family)
VAVTLFSMILATGVGSFVSDKLAIERHRGWTSGLPAAAAIAVLLVALLLQPLIDNTLHFGLTLRCVLTVAVVVPLSLLLGTFFPMGMRLVQPLSTRPMPWMWGINGACGVLAGTVAVAISMWSGIHTNLYVALVVYGLLVIPASYLWQKQSETERARA